MVKLLIMIAAVVCAGGTSMAARATECERVDVERAAIAIAGSNEFASHGDDDCIYCSGTQDSTVGRGHGGSECTAVIDQCGARAVNVNAASNATGT